MMIFAATQDTVTVWAAAIVVVVPVLVAAYKSLTGKIETVHKLVNSQLTTVMAKLDAMTQERDAGLRREDYMQSALNKEIKDAGSNVEPG